jgi:hypothetical protein
MTGSGNQRVTSLAAVSNDDLYVYEFFNDNLDSAVDAFSENLTGRVRGEGVSVKVRSNGATEVIFARCSSDTDPCTRTYLDGYTHNSGWDKFSGAAATPYSVNLSGQCDEFEDLAVAYDGDDPQVLFSYAPCGSQISSVRALDAGGAQWTTVADDLLPLIPDTDASNRYRVSAAVDANGQLFALLRSKTHLAVARIGGPVAIPYVDMTVNLTPNALLPSRWFRSEHVAVDADGNPIVITRFGQSTYVWRVN